MEAYHLQDFISSRSFFYVKKWLHNHFCQIKITKNRQSKLGDYKMLSNKTHCISINNKSDKELFFFILTHEIAHLLAFHENKNILPHGKEWKSKFRELILESLPSYSKELQLLLLKFAEKPKANFMASPDLVKYFNKNTSEKFVFIENLNVGEKFIYRNQNYIIEEKKKTRYICKNLYTGKKYLFAPCTKVTT